MSQTLRISRWINWMICLVAFTPMALMQSQGANASQDASRLESGRTTERMIGGGELHRYQIPLKRGMYLRVEIAQQGIDVIVTALDPAGRRVARIDRPNGAFGPEDVSVIAEAAGDYTIEVKTALKYAAPGRYVITATGPREAKDEDGRRATAEYAVSEAEELRTSETADTLSLSVEKFSQAITIWRSLGERYEEAIAAYGRGWSYQSLGDYLSAICDFRQAVSQMENLQDRNGEAIARSALAWTYIYVGENEQARENFRQTVRTHQSLGNMRSQAIALYGIGMTYALTSEPEQALDYYARSLELRRKVGDAAGEVLTLSAIGITYNHIGRPETGIDYSRRALELSRTLDRSQIQVSPLSKLGWAHLTLGRLDESRDYFEQALRICQSTGDRASECLAHDGLARVEMKRGRLDEARRHIETSLEIIESVRWRNSSLQLRSTYLALAQDDYQFYIETLMRLGQASAALQASERARARSLLDALAEAQIDLRSSVDARLIAEERRLERKLNDLSAAQMRLLSKQHTTGQASALDSNINATIGLLEETRANIKKANPSYAALTQPQPAGVEQIQQELLDDNSLLLEYALGEERSYLFLVSSSSLRTFILPPRAEIEARARRVYDLLSARAFDPRSETSQQRQARIAAADAELPRQAAELSRMILAPAAASLGQKRLLVAAQGALQLVPFAALPEPEAERRGDGGTEGQRDRGTGGQRDGGTGRQRDGERERRREGETKWLGADAPGFLSINPPLSLSVYPFLRPSVSPSLVPSLPPSLHPSVSASPRQLASSTPLLVNHEIVYLPSASTLVALRREASRRRPAPKTIALLADPVFEKSDERLKLAQAQTQLPTPPSPDRNGQIAERRRPRELGRAIEAFGESNDFAFPRLTFTAWEAEQIAGLAPADQVFRALSFDANRELAASGKLSDYRIVHFASHTFINAAHPDLSGIALSLFDRRGQEQDGFLRLHEIYNLKLPADLVVLSGCRTGLGKEIKGEGLMGLTRGFMYAGASRVIVSAWEVQDRPSATLMIKFYRRLLGPARMSTAAALRAAQLEMLRDKQFSAPYFWAGFTLNGEWR